MSQLHKVTVDFPFQLQQNQFEVIKELAEIEGESLGEWIRWCVIKMAESDIEATAGGGNVGQSISERLKEKWGPESPYWSDEEE
jgi:hypothetical protein